MTDPLRLRQEAETLGQTLPPLLIEAEHLAASVIVGAHGRRHSGAGNDFWQYRPAQDFDTSRSIDWRRSARSDQAYVREQELETAQTVSLWVDGAPNMHFSGTAQHPTKHNRAAVLGLAAALLFLRGGERVGLTDPLLPPRSGSAQAARLAETLPQFTTALSADSLRPRSAALFLSDFLGELSALESTLDRAAQLGVSGCLMQVLDPIEESFPFSGRVRFEAPSGNAHFETMDAGQIRADYLEKLAERKDALRALCAQYGWQFQTHHTGDSASAALLWIYGAMERSA